MKILYNFATRSRPKKAIACLENIISLSKSGGFQVIVTADTDDPTMFNDEVRDKINSFPGTNIYYGISKGKIDAINKNVGLAKHEWHILVNVSDDFLFLKDGFDLDIINDMQNHFPDTDGFLHYPDGSPAHDKLATMSIIGKKYYDRFGYVYHPDYKSVYCDNEATVVAQRLHKHIFINNQIFTHNHPAWGKAEVDELYKRNENPLLYEKDKQTFLRRQSNNFDLY